MESKAIPSRSCCCSFFGPFRPVVGGHTIAECGLSSYLPIWLIFVYRLSAALFVWSTLIYYSVTGIYDYKFFTVLSYLLLGFTFVLTYAATLVCALLHKSRSPTKAQYPQWANILANFAVPLLQIFATAALFLTVVFWALLYKKGEAVVFSSIAPHAVNALLVFVDIALAANMEFRLVYSAFFLLYLIAYLAFSWINFAVTGEWVYAFLDYRENTAGLMVAYYFGILFWGVLSGLIVFTFSRVCRLSRHKHINARRNQAEEHHGDETV